MPMKWTAHNLNWEIPPGPIYKFQLLHPSVTAISCQTNYVSGYLRHIQTKLPGPTKVARRIRIASALKPTKFTRSKHQFLSKMDTLPLQLETNEGCLHFCYTAPHHALCREMTISILLKILVIQIS